MRERSHPRALAASLKGHWPDIAEAVKVLPVIARRAIRQAYDDELVVKTESASLEALRAELRADRRRSDAVIAAAAVFVGGIVWMALATQPVWIGWLLTAGGALWLLNRLRA
jgi:hypothetical protein